MADVEILQMQMPFNVQVTHITDGFDNVLSDYKVKIFKIQNWISHIEFQIFDFRIEKCTIVKPCNMSFTDELQKK